MVAGVVELNDKRADHTIRPVGAGRAQLGYTASPYVVENLTLLRPQMMIRACRGQASEQRNPRASNLPEWSLVIGTKTRRVGLSKCRRGAPACVVSQLACWGPVVASSVGCTQWRGRILEEEAIEGERELRDNDGATAVHMSCMVVMF